MIFLVRAVLEYLTGYVLVRLYWSVLDLAGGRGREKGAKEERGDFGREIAKAQSTNDRNLHRDEAYIMTDSRTTYSLLRNKDTFQKPSSELRRSCWTESHSERSSALSKVTVLIHEEYETQGSEMHQVIRLMQIKSKSKQSPNRNLNPNVNQRKQKWYT